MSTQDSDFGPIDRLKTFTGVNQIDEDSSYQQGIYHFVNRLYYPLYSKVFDSKTKYTSKVERLLVQANRSEPVEIYLSSHMGIVSLIGIFFGFLTTITMLTDIMEVFRLDTFYPAASMVDFVVGNLIIGFGTVLTSLAILTIAGGVGAVSGVLFAVRRLKSKANDRKKQINILLPDAIAFMYCLSASGMNRIDIIQELSTSEQIYGEVSVEFQRIVFQLENYSEDYYTAIEDVAESTPSEPLSTFLNDLLSTINSGGDMSSFLETQLNIFMEDVENTQEAELDTLELFNEIYITLSLVPVMGIVIFGFAASMGVVGSFPLLLITYGLIPTIQITTLTIITTIFQPTYGGGTLTPDPSDNFERKDDDAANIFSGGVVSQYRNGTKIFEQIYLNELRYRFFTFLGDPLKFTRDNPKYVFIISAPTTVVFFAFTIITGEVVFSIEHMMENSFRMTLFGFYLPMIVLIAPYLYFYEMGLYRRGKITDGLTTDLSKLANVNDKGVPLQESLYITSVNSDTKLGDEFQEIYKKLQLKVPLGKAIIESNNKYKVPRLARIFRIIKSAQGISNDVTNVLNTASDLAATQEKIIKDRKSRTREQIGIISIIFFVFVACLILVQSFILGDGGASVGAIGGDDGPFGSGAEPVPSEVIELVFYHGAMIQGGIAGLICGYIRTGKVSPGVKYSTAFISVVMVVWMVM